jgi:hypothetical protein
VLLFFIPAVVPVTSTESVHPVLVARVTPDRLTEPEPAVAVAVPPHVLLRLFGVATTKPAGKLSVNPIPVSVTFAAGLLMVKVSEVVPFSGIELTPNTFAIVGGVATLRFALAVFPVPPLVDDTLPVVFVY